MSHPHRSKQRSAGRVAHKVQKKKGWYIAFVPGDAKTFRGFDADSGVPCALRSVPNGDGTYRDEFYTLKDPGELTVAVLRDRKLAAVVEQWQAKGFRPVAVPIQRTDRFAGGLGTRREFLSS